jgi:hypothetical protein
MSIQCDVIMQWNATPAQLRALGAGLWRWCAGAVGQTGMYRLLDNQPLADLIAGKLPSLRHDGQAGVHLFLQDKISPSRRATIASLRREVPATGLVDIIVGGASWNLPA